MAEYTETLWLKKPTGSDKFNIEDFNGNADKIDEFAAEISKKIGSGGAAQGTLLVTPTGQISETYVEEVTT